MKKLLALFLSVLTCFCFAGCDGFEMIKLVPPSMQPCTTYYGVVQTMAENDGLFVYIDGVGLCDIPTYEKEQITVKEGDLLVMDFYTDEVMIMECYPAVFSTPVGYMAVVDFSFSLTWGICGVSSYDSATGRLVKTDDVADKENYETTHLLTAQEKLSIFKIVAALEVYSYPDDYNPTEGKGSSPNQTLILSVSKGNYLPKTITASDVALSDATSEKGQRFMDACQSIADILENTEEWKALPEFPYLYD